jgi:hypothetical protein
MIDGNRKGFPRMSGTSQSTAIFTGQLFSHWLIGLLMI